MTKANPLAERCPAKAKGSGERCKTRVVGGGPCRVHGGKAPQVAAARERRIIAGEAALATAGHKPRSPHDALLAAAGDADAILQKLKEQLREGVLDGDLLSTLGDWLDRTSRLSKIVIDAKLDERHIELAQGQAQIVVAAFRAALDAIGSELLPAAREAATRAFLAALGSGREQERESGVVVRGELG
jgi:hypothetical protein